MLDFFRRRPAWALKPDSVPAPAGPPVVSVDDMKPVGYAGQQTTAPFDMSIYDGSKFPGGFGNTQLIIPDYWTLRARSAQLFETNLYARGMIRRLITNEINTGLTPEGCPDEQIIGVPEESLADWTELTENRFLLWGRTATVCDWKQLQTFGAIQRAARQEAFVSGDVLVVLRSSPAIKTPMVELISGNKVQTPLMSQIGIPGNHKVRHGIELDSKGRTVAFWVRQDGGGSKRIRARGRRSGRLMAWLVFGSDRRLDDLRGQPLLSIVLQSLLEIDRYRDSAQRKALINSFVAMFIKKTDDKVSSLPMKGGAVRRGAEVVTDGTGETRTRRAASYVPGIIMEDLQQGEEPVGFHNQGIDTSFGPFEEVIVQAVAWANEIPPEILRLTFSNNYSASQAAINEFRIYLNKVWSEWGETFCAPIWTEWMLSEVMAQKIDAPGFLEAWRDPDQVDVFGARLMADWYGSIKPSTDMVKQTKASENLIRLGLSTRAREARILTGTRYSKNMKRQKRENVIWVDANTPLAEFKAEFETSGDDDPAAAAVDLEAAEEFVKEILAEHGVDDG